MNAKRLMVIVPVLGLLALAACAPAMEPQMIVSTQVVEFAATPAPDATLGPMDAVGNGVQPVIPAQTASQMIVKDANLNLLVADTNAALAQVTQMAADYGGYVLETQTWESNGYKHATLRLGVPSAQFEKVLNILRNLGLKVLSENTSGQDVSAEYVDLQSRLTNLEATAARVREFLADAKTVEESLRVNQQLSELEAQIEQVKGQMNFYKGRAAFSTITLTLTPEMDAPPSIPTPVWNPGKTFERASTVLVDVAHVAIDLLIWVVVLLGPFALVGGLLFGAAWVVVRKRK